MPIHLKFLTKTKGYKHFTYFCSMALFKRIFDFYLDASIHVALAIFSLVHITALTLDITVPSALYFFIFFGSISCYNFVKYGVEAEKYILVANRYHKNIQFFSIGCLIVAFYHVFFLSERVFVGLLFLAGITGLYALPVLPRHKNFRSLSGLKILIVATVWAGTTVILPVLSQSEVISWDVKVETFQRFLLVLILLVPFEIRDLKYDNPELKTLPQRIGIRGAKLIGVSWTLLFYGSTFLKAELSRVNVITKTILFIVLLIVIIRTKGDQPRYFSSFWVEAIPIFWWLVLVVGISCF
ncbi:hypothetical protein ACNR9Q_06760 [Maribacter sp. X9]|uniref:hypothetical protein n=1 Tax=Maribacter sp. X9 TaxID=3402159 RepID=UPI003AF3DF91